MKRCTFLATTFLLLLLAAPGCGPTVSWRGQGRAPALHPLCCPLLLPVEAEAPAGGVLLGTMKLGDSGLTIRCAREQGLERIRKRACQQGADVVRLRSVSGNYFSTCDYLNAELYRLAERPQPRGSETPRVEDGTALCADDFSLRPRDAEGRAPLRTPGNAESILERP